MFDYESVVNNSNYPWVVFIHGFGGSSITWKGQIAKYSEHFNLLLLNFHTDYNSFNKLDIDTVCNDIHESITDACIKQAHMISMSSGSLIALAYYAKYPKTVISMVLAGGMIRFNTLTKTLLFFARKLKNVIPYLSLYKFFAYIIMPGKNHQKSRDIFVRESDKLGHEEFGRWVDLLPSLIDNNESIRLVNEMSAPAPFLYVMGTKDHLFRKPIENDIHKLKNSDVVLIKDCGHVCTIEKPQTFNEISINFMLNILNGEVLNE